MFVLSRRSALIRTDAPPRSCSRWRSLADDACVPGSEPGRHWHGNWTEVGIAAIGSVVVLLLAAWFLVRMLKTFRKRGYITRYT